MHTESQIHPNEKPVGLMCKLLYSITSESDLVYVPFVGSGADIEACIKTKRRYIGSEITKDVYDIAMKRINTITSAPELF